MQLSLAVFRLFYNTGLRYSLDIPTDMKQECLGNTHELNSSPYRRLQLSLGHVRKRMYSGLAFP
jgi:hypothetical protein